jgi:hypothetical protein
MAVVWKKLAYDEASCIRTDTAGFNNNLSIADDTVQKALDTLDDAAGGTGVSFVVAAILGTL